MMLAYRFCHLPMMLDSMMPHRLLIATFFAATYLILPVTAFAADGWKAGAAQVDITPKQMMWMSGYGGRNKPAEGTLTKLWAKALVMQDKHGERVVMVTLDLVGIGRDLSVPICKQLKELHKLERRQIALNCSHTHTGPVCGNNLRAMYFYDDEQQALVDAYSKRLVKDIVQVVGDAIDQLSPADIEWGRGTATFAVNRRNNREPDVPKLREEGELRGPVDHDVPVLRVEKKGKLAAVLFGYACHATVLSFYQWSGDYPGFAQIEVQKKHPEAIAMFWAGCGADQNPLPRRTVELAKEYGSRLAAAVEKTLNAKLTLVQGDLRSRFDEINLKFGELPSREDIEKNLNSSNKFEAGRAKRLLAMWDKHNGLSSTYPYPVQTWQIGPDLTWITLGGEVVVDFSLRFKREHGDRGTWVAGYTNDVMAYIPSLRVLKEGGYEGARAMIYYGLPTVWSEQVEEHIAATVEKQVKAVRESEKSGRE